MLVSKIKPCMFKKLVVGLWVGSAGPPFGVHRFTRPFCRRYAPGLSWPGRASGAVTLKKLECSKQAYALYTLAWDNIIGFRSYYVCDALRCSGPHARYTDVFNEYIALADRPGKSLKFHRDGDRSLQLLVLNEEFLVSASHQLALTTSLPFPSLKIGRLCCPNCSLEKRPQRRTGPKSPGRGRRRGEANGGRRCVPVGCGTALAGLPIDSGRGPVRIGAAAKAWAVDRPVEMPSCRLWLAARAVTACLGTCALPAPACGHPIRPVLKHGPRRRCGCFVEPCHGIESSKWAIFGKQNWRCGMNRKPGYGAKLRANLEPTKGVGRLRQQDGGHGSRNPLRSVQGKSAKWIRNLGKRIGSEGWARGSQSRTRRLSADCSSCFRGESGSPRAGRGTDWERLFRGPSPGVEQPTQNCALNVKVKKFNQARVNGGSNYDSLKRGNAPLFGPKACFGRPIRAEDIVSQAFIATLLFDPSMSALPIIVKQNSPSVGLFTHQ
ncbi:hypothetical protein LXL04_039389 [Taraxacum kok-saghyz]